MGDREDRTPVLSESPLGYHPCNVEILTVHREPVSGQCLAGSLTGAVASLKSNGGAQRFPQCGRKSHEECKGKGSLTARPTSRAGTKVGLSDPVVPSGRAIAQRIKSYPGDNRLIPPKSPHRRRCLAPRCRLVSSWG